MKKIETPGKKLQRRKSQSVKSGIRQPDRYMTVVDYCIVIGLEVAFESVPERRRKNFKDLAREFLYKE
jgi:hypothetical protein